MITLAFVAGIVWLVAAVVVTVADVVIAGPRRAIVARERRARFYARP